MKKALVTGAAGFIGSNVVRVLLADGVEVRAMVLPGEDEKNLEGADVERIEADLLDPPSLDKALKGVDALFHLAAIYAIWLPDRHKIYRVNLQGSRNILWAARRAGVEKVVYTSSIAALGLKPGDELSNEDVPFNQIKNANDYVLTKWLSQEEALTFAREGLPLVCVNPCFPFGVGDRAPTPTGKLIMDALNGLYPFYFEGGMNIVDVMDVARGHVLAAEKGEIGEKYVLGNRNVTVKEFFDLVGKVSGKNIKRVPLPVFPIPAAGWLMEKIADWRGQPPLLTSKEAPYLAQKLFFDVSKAREKLGLELTPIEDSLKRSIQWFESEGYLEGIL